MPNLPSAMNGTILCQFPHPRKVKTAPDKFIRD
jgi:hypothetical protein